MPEPNTNIPCRVCRHDPATENMAGYPNLVVALEVDLAMKQAQIDDLWKFLVALGYDPNHIIAGKIQPVAQQTSEL